jgi:hypothetical protein
MRGRREPFWFFLLVSVLGWSEQPPLKVSLPRGQVKSRSVRKSFRFDSGRLTSCKADGEVAVAGLRKTCKDGFQHTWKHKWEFTLGAHTSTVQKSNLFGSVSGLQTTDCQRRICKALEWLPDGRPPADARLFGAMVGRIESLPLPAE